MASAAGESLDAPLVQTSRCYTRRERRSCELIWKVDVIAHADTFVHQSMYSAYFGKRELGGKFFVRLRSEYKGSPPENVFQFSLHYADGPSCEMICEISLMDEDGQKRRTRSICEMITPSPNIGTKILRITQRELLDERLKLLRDHEVTVLCVVTVCGEARVSGLHFDATPPKKAAASELSEQWKVFYEQKLDTDVVLRVGGERFEAHRVVLACRSPVFAAMLRSDMREKQSGEIVVSDIDGDVFGELLRFLYADDFSRPSAGFVARLMVAADKYDVQSLKSRCSQHLCGSLRLDEVLEITELCPSTELDISCWHLLQRELFPTTAMVDCFQRMVDFPQVLELLKKRLLEAPQSGPNKRHCPGGSG